MKLEKYVYSNPAGSAVAWSLGRGCSAWKMHRDLNAFSRGTWGKILFDGAFICSCFFTNFFSHCTGKTSNSHVIGKKIIMANLDNYSNTILFF
jgi:hypothetical protein